MEIIKTGTRYRFIETGGFDFRDIKAFLSPEFNLDEFIKAYNPGGNTKFCFPHGLMADLSEYDTSNGIIEFMKNFKISSLKPEHFSSLKTAYYDVKEKAYKLVTFTVDDLINLFKVCNQ